MQDSSGKIDSSLKTSLNFDKQICSKESISFDQNADFSCGDFEPTNKKIAVSNLPSIEKEMGMFSTTGQRRMFNESLALSDETIETVNGRDLTDPKTIIKNCHASMEQIAGPVLSLKLKSIDESSTDSANLNHTKPFLPNETSVTSNIAAAICASDAFPDSSLPLFEESNSTSTNDKLLQSNSDKDILPSAVELLNETNATSLPITSINKSNLCDTSGVSTITVSKFADSKSYSLEIAAKNEHPFDVFSSKGPFCELNAKNSETSEKLDDKSDLPSIENDVIAQGTYTFEFDKFDDPNFDPFKSNKGLMNSPDISKDAQISFAQCLSTEVKEDASKLILPELMPEVLDCDLKELDDKQNMENVTSDVSCSQNAKSSTNIIADSLDSQLELSKDVSLNESVTLSKDDEITSVENQNHRNESKLGSKSSLQNDLPEEDHASANDVLPRGSYAIDFRKFDDPEFDPFKTTKSLLNEDEPMSSKAEVHENSFNKLNDGHLNPVEITDTLTNSSVNGTLLSTAESLIEGQPVNPSLISKTSDSISKEDKVLDKVLMKTLEITKSIKSRDASEQKSTSSKKDVIGVPEVKMRLDHGDFARPLHDEKKSELSFSNSPRQENDFLECEISSTSNSNETKRDASCRSLDVQLQSLSKISDDASLKYADVDFNKEPSELDAVIDITPTNNTISRNELTVSEILPKSKIEEKGQQVVDENNKNLDIIPPKGSYTIDFTKFDDPNFDPFKTTKSLENDLASENVQAKQGAYSVNFDKLDDDFDRFKSEQSVLNSPVNKEFTSAATAVDESVFPSQDITTVHREESSGRLEKEFTETVALEKAQPKFQMNETSIELQAPDVSKDHSYAEGFLPKGSYSIDFSQFGDPNFDPFRSSKALVNDEDHSNAPVSNQEAYLVHHEKSNDPNFDPFDTKLSVQNSATGGKDVVLTTLKSGETEPMQSRLDEISSEGIVSREEKMIVESSRPEPHITNEEKKQKLIVEDASVDDEEPIPKGSYSMDFSKFDDPNFNPFQSTKSLVNDEDHSKECKPQPGAYKTEKFTDSHFDPFKSEKPLLNSPADEVSQLIVNKKSNDVNSQITNESSAPVEDDVISLKKATESKFVEEKENEKTKPSPISKPKAKSSGAKKKKKIKPVVAVDEAPPNDEVSLPKGSYSIDFNKFDDPNFNPFQSNKTLENDEDHLNKSKSKPGTYSMDLDKNDDLNFDPFKSKKSLLNSPTEDSTLVAFTKVDETCTLNHDEPPDIKSDPIPHQSPEVPLSDRVDDLKSEGLLEKTSSTKPKTKKGVRKKRAAPKVETPVDEDAIPKGSYSIDFSKFDDPNFNPFESNKALVNDEDPLSEYKPKPGAYSMDFNEIDDPSFDPCTSKTSIMSSSTQEKNVIVSQEKDATGPDETCPSVPIEVEQTSQQTIENNLLDQAKTTESRELPQNTAKPNSASKKVVKKKKKPKIKNEDEDAVPKGSYSIDFSKFDDPNFDPFQSNKALANDEDFLNEPKPKSGAYSMDFDKFDDPNFDPFKSKKAILNSPTEEKVDLAFVKPKETDQANIDKPVDVGSDQSFQETAEVTLLDKPQTTENKELPEKTATSKPKKVVKKKRKPVVRKDQPAIEDEVAIPKGSYSIDFSKFDDPNFDPFQSNKALANDEDPLNEPKSKPGAYSMDFDKFDDPNFDPFKSEKAILNSPTEEKVDFAIVKPKETDQANIDKPVDVGSDQSFQETAEVTLLDKPQTTENKELPEKTATSKPKKVVKKKRKPVVRKDQPAIEDEVAIPKGSYSIDFSKFDDPNFDPFQSNKALANDEDPLNEPKPKSGAYSMDFDKFDDPNFDPFKSKKAILNSPTEKKVDFAIVKPKETDQANIDKPVDVGSDQSFQETAEVTLLDKPQTTENKELPEKTATSKPKKVVKKKQKPVVRKDQPAIEDEVAIPKGSYSIDFSKFDDPNFDPFQSNKALANDEDPLNEPKSKPGAYSMDFDEFDDPNFDPFKSKKAILNSPTEDKPVLADEMSQSALDESPESKEQILKPIDDTALPNEGESIGDDKKLEKLAQLKLKSKKINKKKPKPVVIHEETLADEAVVPKGAYSIDFSKFDDPNFNPFQSNKTLVNDENTQPKPKPGSYTTDFDDPNLDPFKSKKSIANSPTKEINTMASQIEDQTGTTQTDEKIKIKSVGANDETSVSDQNDPSALDRPAKTKSKSGSKLKKKRKPVAVAELTPGDEAAVPKGSYSIDFSKFDDPNFNPFESKKTLSMNEEVAPSKTGAYTMDFDKFDDPNFDPFKSNRNLASESEPVKSKVSAEKEAIGSVNSPMNEEPTVDQDLFYDANDTFDVASSDHESRQDATFLAGKPPLQGDKIITDEEFLPAEEGNEPACIVSGFNLTLTLVMTACRR